MLLCIVAGLWLGPGTSGVTAAEITSSSASNDWRDLTVEQLLSAKVESPAGLTEFDPRRAPVDMTTLDAKDIYGSGAKDMNHLLEMYVPNAQFLEHQQLGPHLGFRGIISDREDKYLYQVDGITLNNRTLMGADIERDLPLFGDIRSVSVVRGPASATYGSGALIGVIDVEPYSGLTFQGADVNVREGLVDQYTAAEARYGYKFSDTSGLFLYYGMTDMIGADSPYYIGQSYPAGNGLPPNNAGHPFGGPVANLGAAGFGDLWHKAYASYVTGPFEFWARYVQDGEQDRPMRDIYTKTRPPDISLDEWTTGREFRNQEITGTGRFKKDLAPEWNLELVQSGHIWYYDDQLMGDQPEPFQHGSESEAFSRALVSWIPNEEQSLVLGMDYSHEWFDDPPFSYALDSAPVVSQRTWQSDTISFMAEDQWKISPSWTTFLSFRTDKNRFSGWLLSPRATAVFTPTDQDTFKVIAGQSVRRGSDEELWGQWERDGTTPSPETLRTYEGSYERKLTDQWRVSGNAFFEDYNAIGWIPSLYHSASIGRFQIAGGELLLTFSNNTTRLTLSEGVAELVHASVPTTLPPAGQGITSAPYGFGDDLANWAPSITKLAVVQDFARKWSVSSSVIFYSGYPGAQDYANYARTLPNPPSAVPLSDPGYTKPYGPDLFVNLGLEYRPSPECTIRLDGYNLAALADSTLSKRNYVLRTSEFSIEPASVTASIRYRF
ncbi:MAG TPA: TonB-dependent receptor plug domain-containing protein [Verrucomicrobiae bacterium]|nr:TonB-dependent receptor plug domain-containing protein [Verrucomicrobiae bacterium]